MKLLGIWGFPLFEFRGCAFRAVDVSGSWVLELLHVQGPYWRLVLNAAACWVFRGARVSIVEM